MKRQPILKIPAGSDRPQSPYLGFFVGEDGKSQFDAQLRYHGPKHLLSFGTPGANKSMGLVVPNLLLLRRSAIVIDPKGQLAAITHRARSKFGRCIVINPFNELLDIRPELVSVGWNPLLQLYPKRPDFESKARSIAEAMIDRVPGSRSDFFETSSENVKTAFSMHERRRNGTKASLRNVRAMLASSGDELNGHLEDMEAMGDYPEQVAASRLLARLNDTNAHSTALQDVIETVMKNTAFLNDRRIADDMAKGGAIDFAALHREIVTIYVVLPPGQLVKQAKWLRMFFKLAFAELFENAPRKAVLPPVMMFLDEFGNLGHLPEVLATLNIARDYRLQMWMFLQHLNQLEGNYGKNSAAFFAGSGVISTFDCRDWATAEHFSKVFGKREATMQGESFDVRSMRFSQNTSTQVFPLIQPEDLWRVGRARLAQFIDPCPYPIQSLAPG
jgi:type IV secretion system protein VirD4